MYGDLPALKCDSTGNFSENYPAAREVANRVSEGGAEERRAAAGRDVSAAGRGGRSGYGRERSATAFGLKGEKEEDGGGVAGEPLSFREGGGGGVRRALMWRSRWFYRDRRAPALEADELQVEVRGCADEFPPPPLFGLACVSGTTEKFWCCNGNLSRVPLFCALCMAVRKHIVCKDKKRFWSRHALKRVFFAPTLVCAGIQYRRFLWDGILANGNFLSGARAGGGAGVPPFFC